MSRLGRGFPNNALLGPPPIIPVIYDASGQYGSAGGVSTGSWSHTIASNSNALVVAVNAATSNGSMTATCQVGGVPMTLLNSHFYGGAAYLLVWVLYKPPTGTKTIQFSLTATCATSGGSASFLSVGGNGTVTTNAGTGTALSQSATTPAGGTVLQAFGVGGGTSTITSYSQTQAAYVPGVGSQHNPIIVGYGSGTFTATSGANQPWAATAIPLLPV